MLILNKLIMKGFRSFKDETIIDFPEKGAILIKGKFKDRDVSSGTGKSSIMQAIAFALGYSSISQSNLKNWDSKEMLVSLWLKDTVTGTIYKISRNPKLSLMVNDESITGSADEISAKMFDIMKTQPELAKILTHREQRKLGFFINATDAKKKEFLVVVLNLQKIEADADAFANELNQYDREIVSLESSIVTANQMLGSESVSEDTLALANAQYQQAKQSLESIANPQDELTRINGEISQLRLELQKIQQLKMQANSAQNKNQSLRDRIISIKAEIDVLKQNICPTCNRPWDNNGHVVEARELVMKGMVEEMQKNIAVVKGCESVNGDAAIQDQIQTLSAQIGKLKSPVEAARATLSAAESQLRQINNQIARIKSIELDIENKTQKLTETQHSVAHTAAAIKILGREGFLGEIFDEILDDINKKTNTIINGIPNVERFSVYLTSTKENKNGTTKKSISTNVYKDGQTVDLSSMSGGQCAAIEFAADLSVSEAIRRRSGSLLGWLCMDEALNELGPNEKAQAINVIRQNVSGQVLIIDHATEIKEGFEKVVEIEYDGRYSRLVG